MQDTPEPGSGPTTVPVGRWPLVFTVGLVVVLLNYGPLPLLDSIFVSLIVVLLPILSIIQLRALPGFEFERRAAYLNSMGTIAFLALAAMGLGWRRFGLQDMGLGQLPVADLLLWSAGLTVGGMAIMFGFLGIRLALGWAETRFLGLMLPRTPEERRLWVGVSFCAGVGEELVYRGYILLIAWELLPGVWLPVLGCAVLFGVVHAYQGWFGVVRTVVLAVVLSLSMIYAGTLWPAVVAHIAIDLLAGLVFGKVLNAAPRQVGAAQS